MIQVVLFSVILHPARIFYSLSALGLIAGFAWSLQLALREGIVNLKRLHSIPCSNCVYFTGDYHLKCTVHPKAALTEDALKCSDFEFGEDNKLRLQEAYSSHCGAVNVVRNVQRPCG